MVVFDYYVAPILLMVLTPMTCLLVAFLTNRTEVGILGLPELVEKEGGVGALFYRVLSETAPSLNAVVMLVVFNYVALILYWWPGPTKYGPLSENGVEPDYTDNGVAHCFLFSLTFLGGSELGLGWYKLSVLYDLFPETVGTLNLFGLAFCLFLYFKGLYTPSGPDSGSEGKGFIFDYYWGTDLYPRLRGVDVKKFVNCRFSMTFWQLAGISFAAASYEKHGAVDYGLWLCALSQYLYLVKFYVWEIGYMRSIDIIIDRAGFYETWGCLVWVPAIYTLHTRCAVALTSGLSPPVAAAIFSVGLTGVGLNFWADNQRQVFRETRGKTPVWGRQPQYIEATYEARNAKTGELETHTSLLLASGWWGLARHLQYTFELMAAWSWGLLGGGTVSLLPLFYPAFLTILLIHRASRDETKCLNKYGEHYKKYMQIVPYKIVPYLY